MSFATSSHHVRRERIRSRRRFRTTHDHIVYDEPLIATYQDDDPEIIVHGEMWVYLDDHDVGSLIHEVLESSPPPKSEKPVRLSLPLLPAIAIEGGAALS